VLDADRPGPTDQPGEGHHAVTGGPHRRPRWDGEVEPEMPGPEGVLRSFITPDDGTVDRP
jgi:hypothetical protein